MSIFWVVQASALLVFFVTFRWEYLALWAVSHFLRANELLTEHEPAPAGR